MYNLHLVVTRAMAPAEACNFVETGISEWGDENNWRSIVGCVSEKDEVFHTSEGLDTDWLEDMTSIHAINNTVKGWLLPNPHLIADFKKVVAASRDGARLEDSTMAWYGAQKYCEHMSCLGDRDCSKFDVLTENFKNGMYDECGVTHYATYKNADDELLYVVFVATHV